MKQCKELVKYFSVALLAVVMLFSCRQEPVRPPEDYELAAAWADMTTFITRTTPANSPTFASRCFGYIGLTMYESVVHGYPENQSVAEQLNGLGKLPLPDAGSDYHWPMALNAGQAEILRLIYVQTSDKNKAKIDSLEQYFEKGYQAAGLGEETRRRSIAYGKQIAGAIFEWSKTDGGHRGYLKNFDKKLVLPDGPGYWRPPLYAQSFSHYPLHPHWGKNRTFLAVDSALEAPVPLPFDSTPGSPYYNQFLQVYEKRKVLTQDEKEAAIWWGDDPDVSFTPPGHSYHLATVAIKKTRPSLVKCAETYARTGMAVADAFRNCWKWKYQFFTERANTFIPLYIDPRWESFWPDPPFPAFPSGHAIQAAAAATVLTDLFGEDFAFTDSAHVGRERDELRNVDFRSRHFNSFREAAEEIAMSRFYGGIHIPLDNEMGLEKGRIIGNHVNQLKWRRSGP